MLPPSCVSWHGPQILLSWGSGQAAVLLTCPPGWTAAVAGKDLAQVTPSSLGQHLQRPAARAHPAGLQWGQGTQRQSVTTVQELTFPGPR